MLEGLKPPTKNYTCKVRTELAKLDAKDKEILQTAIADPDFWPAKTLSNALKLRGILIVDTGITRHREGICSCSRT